MSKKMKGDSFNLDRWVLDKIDAAIPPLTDVQQSVLDTFAEHVASASPVGVGDASVMCEVPDLLDSGEYGGEFGGIDDDTVIATFHELQKLGLVRIDSQISALDAMLTPKGWLSWSLWNTAEHLPEIAANSAGSAWDWDSLLPTVKEPLRTQVVHRIRTFRAKFPDGMMT